MMKSDSSELRAQLEAGIAAVKRRDLAAGRDLLLQVVEQDDQQELAWLWLSVAVEGAADKEVALENVLTINPDNVTARRRLSRLQKNAGPAGPTGPTAPAGSAEAAKPPTMLPIFSSNDYLVSAQPEPEIDLDDPYQCAFCGQLTKPDDQFCPHCHKGLYVVEPTKETMSEFLKTALMLTVALAIMGVFEVVTPFLALNASQPGYQSLLNILLNMPTVTLLLGNFQRPDYTAAVAQRLMLILAARSALFVVLVLGLRLRWSAAWYAGFVIFIADLMFNMALLVTGYLSIVVCVLNAGLVLVTLFLLTGSGNEFAVVRTRLWTKPDRRAHDAGEFHWRGLVHSREGRWALAVAQWRRAVGLAPRDRRYAKDLGIGYAQMGRFDLSLRVLEEAQRQAPDDPQVAKLLTLVREHIDGAGKPA